jgi:flagellar hook-associated protein 2
MSVGAIPGAGSGPLLKVQGLGSGLKTEEIISALMGVERRPLTQMAEQKAVQEEQGRSLKSLQSGFQKLATSASELASPQLFAKRQTVSSSEPSRVSASIAGGAASGGYQVSVSALASAAQRVFAFASPSAAQTLSIYGHAINIGAGETLAELANAINANSELTVNAAAVGKETLVLSSRATGKMEGNYIEVSDPGGALVEKPSYARAGTNAEYSIDGISAESSSNTLTEAIPGIKLTLSAVTNNGPVSVDVSSPEVSGEKVTEQVKAFVSQYNSAIAKLQSEVSTKPPVGLQAKAESGTGLLFGDIELEELSGVLRQAIYTPVAGLPAAMSSLASIGVGSGPNAAEGQLTIEEATLQEAIKTNPEGVQKMLEGWGARFKKTVEAYAGGTGSMEARVKGDEAQAIYMTGRITALEEALAIRQHTLETQYVGLEVAMRKASSQSSFLAGQLSRLAASSSVSTGH